MDSSLSLGNIAAIVSAIILAVVMLCYLLVCLIIYTSKFVMLTTKLSIFPGINIYHIENIILYTATKNSDITSTHRSSAENKVKIN